MGLEAIVVCQAKVEHADALYALLSQTDAANILFSMMATYFFYGLFYRSNRVYVEIRLAPSFVIVCAVVLFGV